jgi:hypothetical protein
MVGLRRREDGGGISIPQWPKREKEKESVARDGET